MSYLVLARKYRPQTFDQVVKQAHVTQTLSNAIVSDRVAHAILFSGPRGTGKTTVARILAKAMNCKQGPTPVPCNECQSCKEITSGNAADVFEIDGASNNGVDQIRELRENVKYLPAHSPYKIYIIDEVHMLSIAAFNALLKTLEEPPPHVKFFFATTEPHKIPITILSRCQRHDLRRIPIESVSDHMQSLCDREGIAISRESLDVIARESGGSMRDALSLLDQVMTCSEGTEVPHDQALGILGIIDRSVLFETSAAVLRGDVPEILDIIDNIYDHGHNVKEFYSELIGHFRNLLVIRMGQKVEKLVDIPSHEIRLMAEQVQSVSQVHLSRILDILFKEESAIQYSSQPRFALEMAFFRIFESRPVLPIDTLIEKLDALRKGVSPKTEADAETPRAPRMPVEPAESASPRPTPPPPPPLPEGPPQIPENMPQESTKPDREMARPSPMVFNPSESPEQNWEKLLGLAHEKNPTLASNLRKCVRRRLGEHGLEIEVGGNGSGGPDSIGGDEPLLKGICKTFFGKENALSIIPDKKEDAGEEEAPKKKKTIAERKREAQNHPLVEAAIEVFGGRVVEVNILE